MNWILKRWDAMDEGHKTFLGYVALALGFWRWQRFKSRLRTWWWRHTGR